MAHLTRRKLVAGSLGLAATASLPTPLLARSVESSDVGKRAPWIAKNGTIKIGLLWSLSSHLALIERPSRDVGLFWVDRVNADGGIAGLKVEPIVVDAKSDIKAYRQGITDLIVKDNVLATFGGYISASRRAVMPLVTQYDGLFYYPTCYEGRECWQNIICTGPIANQHSFDLIPFMVSRYGPRALFVGSNYVWPRESNRNAKRWLEGVGGELVAEVYVPLGSDDFDQVFSDIVRLRPDWIFSTVVGNSDIYFRREYARRRFSPEKLPTASLTTSEMEVRAIGREYGEGHILSAPYFQSLNNRANEKFVDDFLGSRYGVSGVTHFNMEETYLSFLYFRKSVEKLVLAEGEDALSPTRIREYSRGLEIGEDESPEGGVHLDSDNLNSWLKPRIGIFNAEGQIELLYEREEKIAPKPYVLYPHRGVCRADGLHLPSGAIVRAAS